MKRFFLFLIPLFNLFFLACSPPSNTSFTPSGDTVKLSYAKGFSITKTDSFTVVTVNNPWQEGNIFQQYYLVKNNSVVVPDNGQKIIIPVQRLMVNSATQLGFLEMMNALDIVTGVCNADYIYNQTVLNGVENGEIKDLGDAFNLDMERLMLLQPQAVMTTAYNTEDENTKRLKQSGLNVIYNIEWQEPSILGRAEWIKFIGAFLDKDQLADSLFQMVSDNYNYSKSMVKNNRSKGAPTIFSGQDYRGTWSFTGGKGYTSQLFRDANASYPFLKDTTQVSISSTIEDALLRFSDSDIWIAVQEKSLADLAKRDSRYSLFKAFKNERVYNNDKRVNEKGGNDYWEGAVARPDLLLNDMIKICHPELLPDYELIYMNQLQ